MPHSVLEKLSRLESRLTWIQACRKICTLADSVSFQIVENVLMLFFYSWLIPGLNINLCINVTLTKAMDCIPRLLISEQVVCLCTTAVTQSSNTNVFSKCSSVRCIQPQFVLSAAQPAGSAFYFPGVFRNFKQSILFFIFGAKTLPTVEFTAWTLVLISWLSWASSELLILLPPYHLLSRFSLEYLKCFPRMLKCSPLQKIHQGRAEQRGMYKLAMSMLQLENTGYILLWRPQRSCDQRRYLCKSVIGSIN